MTESKANFQKTSEVETISFTADEQMDVEIKTWSVITKQSDIKTQILPNNASGRIETETIQPFEEISGKGILRRSFFVFIVTFCGVLLFLGSAFTAYFVTPLFFKSGAMMFGVSSEFEKEQENKFAESGSFAPLEEENSAGNLTTEKKTKNFSSESKFLDGKISPTSKESIKKARKTYVPIEKKNKVSLIEKSNNTKVESVLNDRVVKSSDTVYPQIDEKNLEDQKTRPSPSLLKTREIFNDQTITKLSSYPSNSINKKPNNTNNRRINVKRNDDLKRDKKLRRKRVMDEKFIRLPKNIRLKTKREIRRRGRPF